MRRRDALALMLAAALPARGAASPRLHDAAPLSVVTLNLWHDKADWPARQAMIVATLRDLRPDVIVLQEVLQHATLPNQAMTLAQALGYAYRFVSVDAEDAAKRYGNAVLTRHPIVASSFVALQPLDDYRCIAHLRIAFRGQALDVYATHLHSAPAGAAIRRMQAAELLAFIERTRGSDAVLLAGDFNAPGDAPEFATLAARFGHAYDTVHPGASQTAFAHSTLNPFLLPPLRVDHVWFDRNGFAVDDAIRLFDAPGSDGTWASDHFGVLARLRVLGLAM